MAFPILIPKGDYPLITKLLKTTPFLIALLVTPACAAENTPAPAPASAAATTVPTTVELQQQVNVLQLLAQTLKEQRDALLDQLTMAQVQIKQLQPAKK